MSLQDVQNYFYHLCFDEKSAEKPALYRRLVRHRIEDILIRALPLFFGHLSAQEKEDLISCFLSEHGIKTPYYLKIPHEFLDFLMHNEGWGHTYLIELADYEFLHYDLLFQENYKIPPMANREKLFLECKPVLNPNIALRHYQFPIHEIQNSQQIPTQKLTWLCIYRHPTSFDIHDFILNEKNFTWARALMANQEQSIGELFLTFVDAENEILDFVRDLIDKQIIVSFQ